MAQTSDSDLAGRILALESAVRSLQTARASAGTLTSAADASAFRVNGVANAAGNTGWTVSGPTVDVYLPADGRLLIDWSAQQEVYGGGVTGQASNGSVGYRISGPADDSGYALDQAPVLQPPDATRVIVVKDRGGPAPDQLASGSSFDVTGVLVAGWYRVTLAVILTYGNATAAPFVVAANRVLSVTVL